MLRSAASYKFCAAYNYIQGAFFSASIQKTADAQNFSAVFVCFIFIIPVCTGTFRYVINFFALPAPATDRNTCQIP